jgi:hypothetical protein
MRKPFLLAVAGLLYITPTAASAQVPGTCVRPVRLSSPFAFLTVNGVCTDLSAFVTPLAKGWGLTTRATVGGSIVDLSALFNPDPDISFTGTTLNLSTATTTFAFLFGTPIVPDFYSEAVSSIQFSASSVTGTTTVDNSASYPTYISGYGTVALAPTNLGVDAGTAPCIASGDAATTDCPAETAANSFAPTFYDNLEALVTYTQDNIGSTASFTGRVVLERIPDVTTTPEPATMSLLGSGLLVLGAFVSSRRRGHRG